MKSILLVIFIIISFSAGITAFMWGQLAVAVALSIIAPVGLLYLLISNRYKTRDEKPEKKKRQTAVDNYFHHDNN
ncbi:MAG: hypothetical protein JXR86_07965 [Spirochaetales bacterium]|nr:hypothetical protein [Spirochaetales bacterium]